MATHEIGDQMTHRDVPPDFSDVHESNRARALPPGSAHGRYLLGAERVH